MVEKSYREISLYIDKNGKCIETEPELGELEKTLFSMSAEQVELDGHVYQRCKNYAFLGDVNKNPIRHIIYRYSHSKKIYS